MTNSQLLGLKITAEAIPGHCGNSMRAQTRWHPNLSVLQPAGKGVCTSSPGLSLEQGQQYKRSSSEDSCENSCLGQSQGRWALSPDLHIYPRLGSQNKAAQILDGTKSAWLEASLLCHIPAKELHQCYQKAHKRCFEFVWCMMHSPSGENPYYKRI